MTIYKILLKEGTPWINLHSPQLWAETETKHAKERAPIMDDN